MGNAREHDDVRKHALERIPWLKYIIFFSYITTVLYAHACANFNVSDCNNSKKKNNNYNNDNNYNNNNTCM